MPSDIFDYEELENKPDEANFYEIFMANGSVDESDGLIWKDILYEDEWAYRPGQGQKPTPVPLKVVAGHATNQFREIGMQDLIDAFNDGAIDHVTIPTSHEDKPHENTGFIRRLKVEDRGGKKYLRAGMEFTEPEIEGKANRGSIANTSVGVIFDYVQKKTGKKYSQVLGHVALTNKPWINGMKPFGVAASEGYEDDEITPLMLENVVWDTDKSFESLREKVQRALSSDNANSNCYVVDITNSKALVAEYGGLADAGNQDGAPQYYVIPFSNQSDSSVKLVAKDKWIPASKQWVEDAGASQEGYEEAYLNSIDLKDFTMDKRKKLAEKGHALPDGSFPIENEQDLRNAIQAIGRAKNYAQAKSHIIKRAKALGKVNLLPKDWKVNLSDESAERGASDNEDKQTKETINMSDKVVEESSPKDGGKSLDPGATQPEKQAELSEESRNKILEEARSQFSEELSEQSEEIQKLKRELHVKNVNEKIENLKGQGFTKLSGLLAEVRTLYMADNGKPVLVLSEQKDGNDVESTLTASEIIDRVIAALPTKDDKLDFSEMALSVEDHSRPETEVDLSEEDAVKRAEAFAADLGVEFPKKKDGDE